jgi:hypothetical protein
MQPEARRQIVDSSVGSIDTTVEAPFYIASIGLSARPRRTFEHADTLRSVRLPRQYGRVRRRPEGLFDRDTRYLSRLELLIDGMQTSSAPFERPGRQSDADRRSHQSGRFPRRSHRSVA